MFNKSQIQAISHKEGPAIVLAGPGSGKTTVITHRIKNLIENNGVPPESIMVVTFTRAAAANMKQRFFEIANAEKSDISAKPSDMKSGMAYPVTFGTFHSIFYRILRLEAPALGRKIVSDQAKYNYIKEIVIRKRIEVNSMEDFAKSMAEEISRFKGNMHTIDGYAPKNCKKEVFQIVFSEYERTLNSEQCIDFEDMMIKCYRLLKDNEVILKKWQNIYKYILIDEFQDINKIQYEVTKLLAYPENNLFIVGDDDQSIYGFRGACPETMFQFKEDYPKATEIKLNINYRSTPEIVNLSENLISHNNKRYEKHMTSAQDGGEKPDIRKFRNQTEQYKYVAAKINYYLKKGIKPDQIAILVRNNRQIPSIRDFLQNENISTYSSKGKNSLYSGMVAKDVMAYVKAALANKHRPPNENESLMYILNKPSRCISRQVVMEEGTDFNKLMSVYGHNREVFENVRRLKFHLKMIAGLAPAAAATYIRNGTGYEQYLRGYAIENKQKISTFLTQLDRIKNDAAKYATLKDWVEYADVMQEGDRNKDREAASSVRIMTMHSSKGLEFQVVFIVDANQGIIPGSASVREKDYCEERRLFYVAMTRAIQHLHISGVGESLGCPAELSMFVYEILNVTDVAI